MLKNIVILFIVSIFAAAACQKAQTEANATDREQISTSGTPPTNDSGDKQTKPAKNPNSKSFRGMISGIEIQMNLVRQGDALSGTYFYTKVGKDLKLSGKIDKNGKFNLTETDDKGSKTGEWNGTWTEAENSPGVILEGDWNKPKDTEKLGFYATEQVVEFSGDAKFTNKTIKETDKTKRSEIYAIYPEISGVDSAVATKFNASVKNLVTEINKSYKAQVAEFTSEDIKNMPSEMGLTSDIGYDVILANDDLASLIFSNYVFLGGAHGNTAYTSVNYDLKNNKEIKLTDLFEPKSDYVKMISDYSINDLKKRIGEMSDDEWISNGAGADAENFKNWNLTKKGLMFTFEPYQVAAYAAGSQTVIIPYEKLKNMLRKDGITANLAK